MAKNIVILTGAGVSAESGIQTFRGAEGLWEGHPVAEVATPEGFAANPALVYRFYNQRRAKLQEVQPNSAHLALAELEASWPGGFLLITQNVDDLHERAGSRKLIHMHGQLLKALCPLCAASWPWQGDMSAADLCPHCGMPSVRPDIVWFGEMPYEMDAIQQALLSADLFLSVGTSGHVYPAAGFAQLALAAGAHTIEANLEPSLVASSFHETHYGPASEILPKLVAQLIQQH
jgi:NAD-dependent deacetylase